MPVQLKLDDAKKREIIAIVSVGGRMATAAGYVGCCVATIVRMAARDPEFGAALKLARSKHEIVNLTNIQDAGKKNWHASSWLLERTLPNRYGKRPPKTLTREDFAYVVMQFAKIVADEVSVARDRKKVLARLERLAMRQPRRTAAKKQTKASDDS